MKSLRASPSSHTLRRCTFGFAVVILALLVVGSDGQTPSGPVKVTFKDGKQVTAEVALPIDPTPQAIAQHSNSFAFGIKVKGQRITCSEQGSIWGHLRVDGQVFQVGFGNPGGQFQPPRPLPPTPSGKARNGFQATWSNNDVRITQIVELVPSRPTDKNAAQQKRLMDTYRISAVVENIAKDGRARKIEYKSCIDVLVVFNDGALYRSPTTHPGKVLNGMTLRGKDIPEYVQTMQNPDYNNPGFMGTLTFKHNKGDNPDVFVMTNLGVVHQGWEPPAQQAGDSACCILWNAKDIKPGEKRTMVYAYGGGFATDPDNDGRVSLDFGGSFAPKKLFTITAYVEDPAPNQALTLELPAGMERVEGREIQPVPQPPATSASSLVQWKARVLRLGDFEIKVRSSTGVTHVKHVSIQAAGN
jgi:hypothetical protein